MSLSCGAGRDTFSSRNTPRGHTSAHNPHPTQDALVKLVFAWA
jgi:hypothetical protein